ncbi:hypothetical protein K469DRAFT_686700 [Zopfia rhizophila CBS 207.26]|uniref:DUF2019 domain-containing protein n=1 Tax=Zopfia rhizophila CBS 207.26 TaxID=1314779 RepID=A0A6A6EUQ4_9PEZI|nr:hypothetical protein K469DRAFT_686700 [Zopfia rhizophila CBS 207.26]
MATKYQRMHLFEQYMKNVYDFAKADLREKQRLYNMNEGLRSDYMILLRCESFDDGIMALYKQMSSSGRKDMLKYMRPSDLSLLIVSLTERHSQERVIDFAHGCLDKDDYAEFVQYIESDGLRRLALDKADDKEFILHWKP